MLVDALHRANHVAQLAHAGRLDENAVRSVLLEHLLQRFAEIADEAAADASLAHLGHLNAGVLHEAAVNADLAKFVFNQHQLFARKSLGDQFFNQRRFAGSKETGENINFRHCFHLFQYFA